jgi:hypothetical protein
LSYELKCIRISLNKEKSLIVKFSELILFPFFFLKKKEKNFLASLQLIPLKNFLSREKVFRYELKKKEKEKIVD